MRAAIYIRFSNEADMENSERDKRESNVSWAGLPYPFKDRANELPVEEGNGRGHLHGKDTGILCPSFHQ